MFSSKYMPCAECGASVEREAVDSHTCVLERRLEYQMFRMRSEIAAFDSRLREYLDSDRGRFARFLAARQVRRTA